MSKQPNDWNDVDTLMQWGAVHVFPAGVLWVQQEGQVIFHKAYGWLDPDEHSLPVRETALFDLASLTKIFTATAFMTLVAKGKVTVDTPVSEVLPELNGFFRLQPPIDPHTKQPLPPDPVYTGRMIDAHTVTFRHLLTHTAGLTAWQNACAPVALTPVPFPRNLPSAIRRRRLEALLGAPRFVYPPGEGLQYSDVGFILLGEAISRIAHTPLPDYLREAVLAPLGLKRTTYLPLAHGFSQEEIAPTEFCPWRQRRLWGEVHDENAACLGGVAGHAGLFAAAPDVARLGASFLEVSQQVLPPSLVAEMTRQHAWVGAERRGLGWKLHTPTQSPVGESFGPRSFGHTGFTGTSLWVDPERRLVIALLTNRVYHGRNPQAIGEFRVRLHHAVSAAVDASLEEKQ